MIQFLFYLWEFYLAEVNEIHEGSEVCWSYIRQQKHRVLKRKTEVENQYWQYFPPKSSPELG